MSDESTPKPPADEDEESGTVKCRYCWRDMPAEATTCPHCGISRHQERPIAPMPPDEPKKRLGCMGSAVALLLIALLIHALT